jgi:hypothetical protein
MSGSAPNVERSQHATRLMLARYEQLAAKDEAGMVITTFLDNVAPMLRHHPDTVADRSVARPFHGAFR